MPVARFGINPQYQALPGESASLFKRFGKLLVLRDFIANVQVYRIFWNVLNKLPKDVYIMNAQTGDVKFEDVNKDGKINSLDRVRLDFNYTPEIVYGFHHNVQWKGFDLSLLFAGRQGQKLFFIFKREIRKILMLSYLKGEVHLIKLY